MHNNSPITLCFLGFAFLTLFVLNTTGAPTPNNGESNRLIHPSPPPSGTSRYISTIPCSRRGALCYNCQPGPVTDWPSWDPLPPSPHIGVCYGTLGSNLPSPTDVVAFYKQNNIGKIRVYNPDHDVLQALRGSNIEVMLGVPNADIDYIAASQANADAWVQNNVTDYGDVKFRYISVGRGLNPDDLSTISLLPAIQNIHNAVSAAGLDQIKVSTSINTSMLGTSVLLSINTSIYGTSESAAAPSNAYFREDCRVVLDPVIRFLKNISAPLLIDVYPYSTYLSRPDPTLLSYAVFHPPNLSAPLFRDTDYTSIYYYLFDLMVDAVSTAIEKSGGGSLEIVVSETGWPSAGADGAGISQAQYYIFNLIKHVKEGTPKNPTKPIETYISSIFDENGKHPEVEQHWGLFLPNKQPKYESIRTPLFQASSAPADPPDPFPPRGRKNRIGLLLAVGIPLAFFALILGLGFILLRFWRQWKENELDVLVLHVSSSEFQNGMGPREFSFHELAKATNNFADEEKLGEGGFGAVYKGVLRDSNTNVAVKRVSRRSKQGIKEYVSEVKIISRLRHKNLLKLIGWCHEKELLLAYEFMPRGSLDFHLFNGRSLLPWNIRYKIAQGLASALLYLQEEGDFCVLHRDIKASNIMLDSAFNAKLGDFGLARLVDHEKGSQTTLLAGTMGYIAPECHRTGKASKESDVYSYGIVALELACGRRSIEPRYEGHQASLVAWVWEAYGNQMLLDVADKKLSTNFNVKEMECLLLVGLWSVHPCHSMRPSIRHAIQVLNFEAGLPNLPSKMPVPNYDDIPSTSIIRISEPGALSITVPR